MHAIWTGNISFGLVSIPVKLVSATRSEEREHFSLFCAEHQVPVHYQRWCAKGEHTVAWDQVLKGMEVGHNKYYLFTKEKLASLKPSKTETIEIEGFYPHGEVKTAWIDKHYYLLPGSSTARKPYALLFEALQDTEQVALATFVMHERQHVSAIQALPESKGLQLTTLHYAEELAEVDDAEELKDRPAVAAGELALAKEIIAKRAKKHIDLSHYKDGFSEKLDHLAHGKKVAVEPEPKRPEHASLMDALRESVK